eukprot:GFYU01005353.1.p1 GENE.GFYU01005353.1~~GFYU01005353.1.p1  ORF type:complete len:298 (-),score=83.54 GFYU01005353.1:176-1069(-)
MSQVVAYVGLGAMGTHMAAHLSKSKAFAKTIVWNRTFSVAQKHASEHGTVAVEKLEDVAEATVICSCLPTSDTVDSVVEVLLPLMKEGTLWIDLTSGAPEKSQKTADRLAEKKIRFVDAPVSGGPAGSQAGTLCIMMGGSDSDVADAMKVVEIFGKKLVHVGPVTSGHAVKAINNALNISHLLLAGEGLLALKKIGISPSKALEVINGSSGRSMQTEGNLPNNVVTGKFGFGFKLGLMSKDYRIARELVNERFPEGTMFNHIGAIVQECEDTLGYDADYTEAVKLLEKRAGAELREN